MALSLQIYRYRVGVVKGSDNARLQVLATGWVSPTVLRERSLEGKTHVDRYEQYQSFSVNYRQYCHFRFDIFALIIKIIRVKYVRF